MSIRVNYSDFAVGSKQDCTVTANDKKPYIDLNNLNNDNTNINQYGSNEWNRTLLDGSFYDLPEVPLNQVYISESLSDDEGEFATPIVITRQFTNQYMSPGISFLFDNGTDKCWCNNLNVKWYRDSTLLADDNYQPDDVFYFCQKSVSAFNKVVITFYSTNKPYRFLRIVNIDDGVNRIFTEEELTGIKVVESISESGDSLSINSTEINLLSNSNVDYIFQRTQPIEVELDNQLISKSFNQETTKNIGQNYQIYAEDYIGVLERETFYGGNYSNYSLETLLTEICGDVPHNYNGTEKIYGYLPVMSRREALQYVAFATGKTVDCSRSDLVQIKTLSSTLKTIPESRVLRFPTESINKTVTGIKLAEHTLVPNSESTELIKDNVNGTFTYTWGEPHHSYSISGGTLVSSGPNYATVTGTGATLTLTGLGYDDNIREIIASNPLAVNTDLPNVIEKKDNMLITAYNSTAVMNRLKNIYFRKVTLSATIIFNGEKVGDRVSIPTGERTVTGRINSIELNLETRLANIEILEE